MHITVIEVEARYCKRASTSITVIMELTKTPKPPD